MPNVSSLFMRARPLVVMAGKRLSHSPARGRRRDSRGERGDDFARTCASFYRFHRDMPAAAHNELAHRKLCSCHRPFCALPMTAASRSGARQPGIVQETTVTLFFGRRNGRRMLRQCCQIPKHDRLDGKAHAKVADFGRVRPSFASKQFGDGRATKTSLTATHPAPQECLSLIRSRTACMSSIDDLSSGHFFAPTYHRVAIGYPERRCWLI